MRFPRAFLLLACGLAACHNPTAVEPSALVGDWAAAPSINSDGSTYRVALSLRADGSFVRDWRFFRPDATGAPRVLVGYVTTEGTFTVREDSLFMRGVTTRSWDRDFNGGQVTVTQVGSRGMYGNPGARFELLDRALILHYLTYPADAAVETMESLFRILPD